MAQAMSVMTRIQSCLRRIANSMSRFRLLFVATHRTGGAAFYENYVRLGAENLWANRPFRDRGRVYTLFIKAC